MSKTKVIEVFERTQMVVQIGTDTKGRVTTVAFSTDELETLNSDYINDHFGDLQDTAYKKGLHDGESKCRYCNEYQRGLNEAWEAAKKLFSSMAESDIEKAFPTEWNNGGFNALINLQPQEAIEKLKAYEEKQKADDKIVVGDEVEWTGDKYIVTYINYNIDTSEITDYDLLGEDGSVADHVKKCSFVKTGRHFDIQSILEEMQK